MSKDKNPTLILMQVMEPVSEEEMRALTRGLAQAVNAPGNEDIKYRYRFIIMPGYMKLASLEDFDNMIRRIIDGIRQT